MSGCSALVERPESSQWPHFSIEIDRSPRELRVRVRNNGATLREVEFTLPRRHWSPEPVEPLEMEAISPKLVAGPHQMLQQAAWPTGDVIELTLRSRDERGATSYAGFLLEALAPVQRVTEFADEDGAFAPVASA